MQNPQTKIGFYMEDDVYYEEVHMVGTAISDWGPAKEPRRKPWQKKNQAKPKPTFGFSRVLDES